MVCSEIKLAKVDGIDIFHREVTAMRTLEECRYVVLWDDLSFDPERLIVHLHMDVSFKPEITLENFIKASKLSIRKEIVAVIINTLAKALVDCHQKGVYHQDIRPRNSEFFFGEKLRTTFSAKSMQFCWLRRSSMALLLLSRT
jgi:serine/threonine protein kinase